MHSTFSHCFPIFPPTSLAGGGPGVPPKGGHVVGESGRSSNIPHQCPERNWGVFHFFLEYIFLIFGKFSKIINISFKIRNLKIQRFWFIKCVFIIIHKQFIRFPQIKQNGYCCETLIATQWRIYNAPPESKVLSQEVFGWDFFWIGCPDHRRFLRRKREAIGPRYWSRDIICPKAVFTYNLYESVRS